MTRDVRKEKRMMVKEDRDQNKKIRMNISVKENEQWINI